jgi:hypothetical protein
VTKWFMGLALALAVVVAGCGGKGGGGDRLTKPDFIKQADAICAAAHTKEQAVDFPATDPKSASDADLKKLADAIDAATKIDRQEIKDLQDLNPPADFEDGFAESLKELGEGLDHAESAAEKARNADKDGVTRELAAVEAKANEANDRAKAYGLKVCGGTT